VSGYLLLALDHFALELDWYFVVVTSVLELLVHEDRLRFILDFSPPLLVVLHEKLLIMLSGKIGQRPVFLVSRRLSRVLWRLLHNVLGQLVRGRDGLVEGGKMVVGFHLFGEDLD
jgi:hypothetical protein